MKHAPMHVAWLTVAVGVCVQPVMRRDSSQGAGAIGYLRAIHSAQQTFAFVCGAGLCAASLDDLQVPTPGTSTGFIAPHVATESMGYTFALDAVGPSRTEASCNGALLASSYFAHAEPLRNQQAPSFAIDATGSVYTRRDGAAIAPSLRGAERMR